MASATITAPVRPDLVPSRPIETSGSQRVPRSKLSPLERVLVLYLPLGVGTCFAYASSPDDSFITLRYAANLLHGHGLVFNRGEQVQGFTSPLHIVVAMGAYLFPGGHDLFKMKLASLLFAVLAVNEAGRLLYGLSTVPLWAKRLGCVAVASSWVLAYGGVNGMETTLCAWLLIAVLRRLMLRGIVGQPKQLALLSALAVLARPDACLAVLVLLAVGFVVEGRRHLRAFSGWSIGPVVAIMALALLGVGYFHDLLPNTYYAKNLPVSVAVRSGWQYLGFSLQPGATLHYLLAKDPVRFVQGMISATLLLVQVLLFGFGCFASQRTSRRWPYLPALVLAQVVFVLKSGGDWMTGGRFVLPAMLPFVIVEVVGLVHVQSVLVERRRFAVPNHYLGSRLPVTMMGAFLAAASVFPFTVLHDPVWAARGIDDASLLSSSSYGPYPAIWTALPPDLACLPPGSTVATSEVGYLGFTRQDLTLIDLRGLTSSVIARDEPQSAKRVAGVVATDWANPTSVEGRLILRSHVAVIAEFDTPAQDYVLGGRYRLVSATTFGAPGPDYFAGAFGGDPYSPKQLALYVPVDSHLGCPRPATSSSKHFQ